MHTGYNYHKGKGGFVELISIIDQCIDISAIHDMYSHIYKASVVF